MMGLPILLENSISKSIQPLCETYMPQMIKNAFAGLRREQLDETLGVLPDESVFCVV